MSSLVGAGHSRSRRCYPRSIRGDASSGGARNFVDAHAWGERRGARCPQQKPGDCRTTRRRPQPGGTARHAAHVPLPRRGFQDRAGVTQSTAEPLPGPSKIRPLSRWPIRSWGGRCYIMGDLGGARIELEAVLRIGRAPQRTRSIYLAYDRHYRAGIALARTLWLQGYPAQAVERADADHQRRRTDGPSRIAGRRLGLGCVGIPLDRRSPERRKAHRFVHLPCRIPFAGTPRRGRTSAAKRSWPSAGAMQRAALRACGRVWRKSTRCVTS